MNQCTETITIRAARVSDMEQIARIYAYYVTNTTISFETTPPSAGEMALRFLEIEAADAPYLVATEGENIIGYAYAASYKARAAYRYTLEHSIYLNQSAAGKGLGRALLEKLIEACKLLGFAAMLATVTSEDNHASLRLHAHFGFVPVGVLKRVGFKHGRWLDVTLLQLSLRGEE